MATPPGSRPDFGTELQVYWPLDTQSYEWGDIGRVIATTFGNVVPVSRLHHTIPSGYKGSTNVDIPPVGNYWIDLPAGMDVNIIPVMAPTVVGVGPVGSDKVEWRYQFDGSTYLEDFFSAVQITHLCLLWEYRWPTTDVLWLRVYTLGFSWIQQGTLPIGAAPKTGFRVPGILRSKPEKLAEHLSRCRRKRL